MRDQCPKMSGLEITRLGIYPKAIIRNVGKVICTEWFTVIFFLIDAQEFGFCWAHFGRPMLLTHGH